MINSLSGLFNIEDLRKKILFTLGMIIVFRLGAHISVGGIDLVRLNALIGQGNLVGFLDLFTGGALVKFSIFAMGIVPYINSSIVMQLLTAVIPQLEELKKEGDHGRKLISQYTRYLAVGFAVFQSIGMTFWLKDVMLPGYNFTFFLISTVVSLTAGSALVMWLSELITERGIGNGASLLIFFGIVARLPSYIGQTMTVLKGGGSIVGLSVLLSVFLIMIVSIIIVQEGQRRVPVQYAKRIVGRKVYGGQSTYIPIRLNQGGVIPIIFASSFLMFPATIAQFVPNAFFKSVMNILSPSGSLYVFLYFGLIFFFSYFYTAITFNPKELADNIKKYGGFITGIRPGNPTAEHLEYIVTRLTLVGATFLALIAIVPSIVEGVTRITTFQGLGGTALLIIVGVALDLVRQIQAQLISRQYERLLV